MNKEHEHPFGLSLEYKEILCEICWHLADQSLLFARECESYQASLGSLQLIIEAELDSVSYLRVKARELQDLKQQAIERLLAIKIPTPCQE